MALGDPADPTWVEFRSAVATAIARRRRSAEGVIRPFVAHPVRSESTFLDQLRMRLPWFLGGKRTKA